MCVQVAHNNRRSLADQLQPIGALLKKVIEVEVEREGAPGGTVLHALYRNTREVRCMTPCSAVPLQCSTLSVRCGMSEVRRKPACP